MKHFLLSGMIAVALLAAAGTESFAQNRHARTSTARATYAPPSTRTSVRAKVRKKQKAEARTKARREKKSRGLRDGYRSGMPL